MIIIERNGGRTYIDRREHLAGSRCLDSTLREEAIGPVGTGISVCTKTPSSDSLVEPLSNTL